MTYMHMYMQALVPSLDILFIITGILQPQTFKEHNMDGVGQVTVEGKKM